jgi:glycosyltransferase involved in cell wall biosynthesis
MSRPLISVVVPAYNHSIYIVEALRSVVEQDYRPLECIVIDDGSSDDTAQKAAEYLEGALPTGVVISRPNRGAANTINQAIGLSRGDYVTILNSDDFYGPGRLAACVSFAERAGRQFVYTGVEYVDRTGDVAQPDDYIRSLRAAETAASDYPAIGFAFMRNQLAISTGNFFFSRALWDKVGPFRNYRYVHDWDFLLRSMYWEEPAKLDQTSYFYRLHDENSFKTLADVAAYETTEVMRNFLWGVLSARPLNVRCPCPAYWPEVFWSFVKRWNYQVYLPPAYRSGPLEE